MITTEISDLIFTNTTMQGFRLNSYLNLCNLINLIKSITEAIYAAHLTCSVLTSQSVNREIVPQFPEKPLVFSVQV